MNNNEIIELKLQDWLFNVGLVGFLNIIEKSHGKEELEKYFTIDKVGVKFSKEELKKILENFEYKYFDFFIDRYGKTLTYGKIVSFEEYINKIEEDEIKINNLENIKIINEKITFFKEKIKSNSYKSTYNFIEENGNEKIEKLEKKLKKVKEPKSKENIDETIIQEVKNNLEIMKKIINFFKIKISNERGYKKNYLAAKNIAYIIINNAWNSVSFLNRTNAAKDIYNEYKTYFVDTALKYINEDKSKYKYNCIITNMPMKNYENTLSFISNTGFDTSRKPSHVWNFINDIGITPLATLIYSCIPAGFVYGATKGIFVNANHNIKELIKINNGIVEEIYNENINNKSTNISLYKNLLKEVQKNIESTKYELSDIQIVKYENETYKFSLLSKNILNLLFLNKDKLDGLIDKWYNIDRKYSYLYDDTITELLNNVNLFSYINKLCHYKISKVKSNYKTKNLEDLLKINLEYIRRLKNMKDEKSNEKKEFISQELEEKDIYIIRKNAMEFKKKYLNKSKNENKMGSLLYRLQNSLRINDVNMFMDTLVSIHSYADQKVHYLFGKALVSDENFQTLGHAFLIGLLGEEKSEQNTSKEVINEENNKEGNE